MVASNEEDKPWNKILKCNPKKRKYKRCLVEDENVENDEEANVRRERIRVLREAQKVKEKTNWLNWMDNIGDKTPKEEEKKENLAMEGLKHNFEIEQKDDAQDERMKAFIESHVSMKRVRETEENHNVAHKTSLPAQWEQIRQLKQKLGLPLNNKPYQPEASFPAGGMEEVLLADSSPPNRKKVEED